MIILKIGPVETKSLSVWKETLISRMVVGI